MPNPSEVVAKAKPVAKKSIAKFAIPLVLAGSVLAGCSDQFNGNLSTNSKDFTNLAVNCVTLSDKGDPASDGPREIGSYAVFMGYSNGVAVAVSPLPAGVSCPDPGDLVVSR